MEPQEELKSQPSDHGSEHSNRGDNTNALLELTSQLGQLTLSMQDMKDDLKVVKDEVRSVRVASDNKSSYSTHRIASDFMSVGGSAAPTTEAPVCLPSGAKVSTKTINCVAQVSLLI